MLDMEARVSALETAVSALQASGDATQAASQQAIKTINDMSGKLDAALVSINRLTAIDQNVTSILGFVQKHGYKILLFGAGAMSSLGVGNPHLWDFIQNFK